MAIRNRKENKVTYKEVVSEAVSTIDRMIGSSGDGKVVQVAIDDLLKIKKLVQILDNAEERVMNPLNLKEYEKAMEHLNASKFNTVIMRTDADSAFAVTNDKTIKFDENQTWLINTPSHLIRDGGSYPEIQEYINKILEIDREAIMDLQSASIFEMPMYRGQSVAPGNAYGGRMPNVNGGRTSQYDEFMANHPSNTGRTYGYGVRY